MLWKLVPQPDCVRVERVEMGVYSGIGDEKAVCVCPSDNLCVLICRDQVIQGISMAPDLAWNRMVSLILALRSVSGGQFSSDIFFLVFPSIRR